jgi:hypothetical protein
MFQNLCSFLIYKETARGLWVSKIAKIYKLHIDSFGKKQDKDGRRYFG